MSNITITKMDETYIKVTAEEPWMEYDISEKFCYEKIGAQYDVRVKKGYWDGKIRLYNRKTHLMYLGLYYELLSFLDSKKLSYSVVGEQPININEMSDDDLNALIETIDPHIDKKPIKPHWYQYDALKYQLTLGRTTSLAATSAGKSLIIYLSARIYQLTTQKKIFIIVPSANLVEQMYADFNEYSTFEGSTWNVMHHCQKISGKYTKAFANQIIITTWQSLNKMPKCLMNDADVIFVDEVHGVRGTCLTDLMVASTNVAIRHGLTGTLDDVEYNELITTGLMGPIKRIVTAKQLIDEGDATKLDIQMLIFNYKDSIKKQFSLLQKNTAPNKRYEQELQYLYTSKERTDNIQLLVSCMKGNSLVLFDRVEDYGIKLYEEMKAKHKNTFLIVGEVDTKIREQIRNILETYDDAIVYASYGTMSTGISIKKLHNLICTGGGKSKIRFLQTIGRLMRKHKTKLVSKIFDIVDDLCYKGKENYFYKHGKERSSIYITEEHSVSFNIIDI